MLSQITRLVGKINTWPLLKKPRLVSALLAGVVFGCSTLLISNDINGLSDVGPWLPVQETADGARALSILLVFPSPEGVFRLVMPGVAVFESESFYTSVAFSTPALIPYFIFVIYWFIFYQVAVIVQKRSERWYLVYGLQVLFIVFAAWNIFLPFLIPGERVRVISQYIEDCISGTEDYCIDPERAMGTLLAGGGSTVDEVLSACSLISNAEKIDLQLFRAPGFEPLTRREFCIASIYPTFRGEAWQIVHNPASSFVPQTGEKVSRERQRRLGKALALMPPDFPMVGDNAADLAARLADEAASDRLDAKVEELEQFFVKRLCEAAAGFSLDPTPAERCIGIFAAQKEFFHPTLSDEDLSNLAKGEGGTADQLRTFMEMAESSGARIHKKIANLRGTQQRLLFHARTQPEYYAPIAEKVEVMEKAISHEMFVDQASTSVEVKQVNEMFAVPNDASVSQRLSAFDTTARNVSSQQLIEVGDDGSVKLQVNDNLNSTWVSFDLIAHEVLTFDLTARTPNNARAAFVVGRGGKAIFRDNLNIPNIKFKRVVIPLKDSNQAEPVLFQLYSWGDTPVSVTLSNIKLGKYSDLDLDTAESIGYDVQFVTSNREVVEYFIER